MPVHTPQLTDSEVHCPDFTLPSVVDGKMFSLTEIKNQNNPFLVMFICNHCPYVKAIEDRLIALAKDLQKKSAQVIAICSNDEFSYPDDSLVNLRARAIEKNYPFIYLHDKSQSVAKLFGAVCTPDYFGYDNDGLLAYRGRLDDSWKDPTQVTTRELYLAMTELSENKKITRPQTPSMGCSIKWLK